MNASLTDARRDFARSTDLVRSAVRTLGRFAIAALVVFHACLLGAHLVEGQAFEPATAARWALAVLVLTGFRAINRRGLSLVSGRHAVVLWLLVVIIHCSAAWDGGATALDRAIPESVTALAELSLATAVFGAALVAALASTLGPGAPGRTALAVPALIAGLPSVGVLFRFSPRPPPLA